MQIDIIGTAITAWFKCVNCRHKLLAAYQFGNRWCVILI